MLDDEKYQREAFQALLLQQDHKALEIGEQMSRIQNELASLTSVELKKKDLKVNRKRSLQLTQTHFHQSAEPAASMCEVEE